MALKESRPPYSYIESHSVSETYLGVEGEPPPKEHQGLVRGRVRVRVRNRVRVRVRVLGLG